MRRLVSLRETFVPTTVAGFHVEDRNMETLCAYYRQTAVGIAKYENCIGTGLVEEFVAAVDDVTASCT